MTKASLLLVEIPYKYWTSFPAERTLESLAIDAHAAERRIKKGYELQHNRAMYIQFIGQMHQAGLALFQNKHAFHRLEYKETVLLQYLERIYKLPNEAANKLSRGFLAPGENIKEALNVSNSLLKTIVNTPHYERLEIQNGEIAEQVNMQIKYYENALKENSGILNIIVCS